VDGDSTTTSQLVAGITDEIKSFGDHQPDSGQLERLLTSVDIALRGRQRVVEAQALTTARDPRFVGKSAEEVGALRGADAVAQVRVQFGDAAASAYAASLETPEGKAQLLAVGQLTLAYRDNGGNLQAIKDGIIPAGLRAGGGGTSGAAQPTDVTVIGKAIEKGIENSPEAQRNIGAVVKEVGLRGVSALSSATLDRNRSEAETAAADGRAGAYSESQNLLAAAGTLLSISTVKKLVDKAGGVLRGGINPGGDVPRVDVPDVPKVDVPDASPASSVAANAASLREQLLQADFFTSAGKGLDDVRAAASKVPGVTPSSTSGIALVEITGLPDGLVLKANSGVKDAANRLIEDGSQSFKFDTLPNAKGRPIARNADVEYKILDNLADQLGSNVNASGKVTIIIDNPRVCGSCQSVISQFEARYKNIKVEVIKRPKPPTPIALPPKGR
jgi:hypothetical protein